MPDEKRLPRRRARTRLHHSVLHNRGGSTFRGSGRAQRSRLTPPRPRRLHSRLLFPSGPDSQARALRGGLGLLHVAEEFGGPGSRFPAGNRSERVHRACGWLASPGREGMCTGKGSGPPPRRAGGFVCARQGSRWGQGGGDPGPGAARAASCSVWSPVAGRMQPAIRGRRTGVHSEAEPRELAFSFFKSKILAYFNIIIYVFIYFAF